ncbi:hypothetical protein EK21DRAFT_55497, partial [Setomelanomma holmii]
GTAPIPKTTTVNIQKRRTVIPLLTLMKTFPDAIFITRVLGIQYFWIDALCIMQDYLPDWEE